jgi:acyl carrier protein
MPRESATASFGQGHCSMSDPTVTQKIITALADYLKRDPKSIEADHHLRDDLGLDSMAVIELLYKIEEVFNIQIPDQDLVGLSTVGAVAQYVDRRLAPAKQPAAATRRQAAKAKKKP